MHLNPQDSQSKVSEFTLQPEPLMYESFQHLRMNFTGDHHFRYDDEEPKREPVYLNVYNVTTANSVLEWIGFGLYHTSVSCLGLEFSYGGHPEDEPGTMITYEGNQVGLELKEKLLIGYTLFSLAEINDIVDHLGTFWPGNCYDPFRQNCNHFTETFLSLLLKPGDRYMPAYVNRFTRVGSLFRMWFHPLQKLTGNFVELGEPEARDQNTVSKKPLLEVKSPKELRDLGPFSLLEFEETR